MESWGTSDPSHFTTHFFDNKWWLRWFLLISPTDPPSAVTSPPPPTHLQGYKLYYDSIKTKPITDTPTVIHICLLCLCPPVSLNVSPNLQQLFENGPDVSVSCVKDGRTVDGWTVKRTIDNKTLECGAYCSMTERFIRSACVLNTYINFTGVYWCETRSGLKSDQATITVTSKEPLFRSVCYNTATVQDSDLLL